jgi:hypothetical protein
LGGRVETHRDSILTEEATKNALVMPFLQALGYDVFNPAVVVPEFVADVGVKKGEKVDYALKRDDHIIALVECKPYGSNLAQEQFSQLYRYFSVTEARIAILTNGVEYWFYSDLDERNKMDAQPFFKFDLTSFRPPQIQQLEKFRPESFELDRILDTASFLKYSQLVQAAIAEEMEDPSDDLVRLFAGRVFPGRFTKGVRDQFHPIVSAAFRDLVRDQVNQRLTSALEATSVKSADDAEAPEPEPDVVTTEEELEAFQIMRAIVREVIDVNRVAMRDAKSYCAILVDDNNRRPLARLHFNRSQKYIGIFENKEEDRRPIDSLEEIFGLADRLKAAAVQYDG